MKTPRRWVEVVFGIRWLAHRDAVTGMYVIMG